MLKIYLILLFVMVRMKMASLSDGEPKYRLPSSNEPLRYNLTLTLNLDQKTFQGKLYIKILTRTGTNSIYLHASPNRITNITKVLLNYAVDCTPTYLSEETEILNITCPHRLEKNDESNLIIDYEGKFGVAGADREFLGFYRTSYVTIEGERIYAVTQFEPTFARTAFPCFDEPQFKTPFQLIVNHPESYTVLSNTQGHSKSPISGIVQTKFKDTPPISTYLVAFFISQFNVTSEKPQTVPTISVYSRASQVAHTGTSLKFTKDLVSALGNWLGITYEQLGIDKLDLVAVPQFTFGAMENWGLITFQEADLLDEGNKTSNGDLQNIVSTIAHELAHHWFGDYVTLDWWSNAWLNEGFATYFQYHIPDLVNNSNMELERQFVPLSLHAAFESDGAEAQPLSSPFENINSPSEILNKFDIISYDKGASIIRMIKTILGEKNFQQSLQSYLTENSLKTSNPVKLLYAIDESYDKKDIDLKEALGTWIYQSGYPIVSVHLKNKTTIELTQKEFPRNLESDSTENPKSWSIPITFTTSKNINFNITDTLWLTDNSTMEIPIASDSWIILNLQQTGYYRVNYNEQLWERLITVLNSNDMKRIHVSNRAQLIDDVFALAKYRKTNYSIAFELGNYLVNEREFEPWYAVAKSLDYIRRMLEVHSDAVALRNFETVVLRWVNGAFPNDENMPMTTHLQVLTYQVINNLKCYMNDGKCLGDSQKILREYLTTKKIENHNLRKTALCFGLKNSKTPGDDYNKLLQFYKDSNSALERRAILASLGCIKDSTVLKKYLYELISNNTTISATDIKYVYKAVISNTIEGIEATLPFLRDHLKDVLDRYPGLITLSDLVLEPAKWIISGSQLNKFQDIIAFYAKVDGMKEVGKKALELPSIYNCWFHTNKKDIELILETMVASSSILTVSNMLLLVLSVLFIFKM